MIRLERSGSAHEISSESDAGCLFCSDQMCLHGVGEIDSAIEVFVCLEVRIVKTLSELRIVVGLGEEPRSAENDRWQPLRPVKELTEFFCSRLGNTIDK